MDERNASQNLINLNIGQLLNLLDNVNKNYVRKFEKLNKSFVNNKYGISFNKSCINEELLPNYTNIYIYIYASNNNDKIMYISWTIAFYNIVFFCSKINIG